MKPKLEFLFICFIPICFIMFFITFFMFGCSGKVQTNKIPNETKYFLPKEVQVKEVGLDSKELQTYSLALDEFFKREIYNDDDEKKQDIYQKGIQRGYFK